MVAWRTQNVRRDGSSITWYQPCNNQTALYVHHFGGFSKQNKKTRKKKSGRKNNNNKKRRRQELAQNRMQQKCNESAQERRIALYIKTIKNKQQLYITAL